MPIYARLSKGTSTKKYKVSWTKIAKNGYVLDRGTVQFGQKDASDFRKHKNKKRRMKYLKRHGAVYPTNKLNDVDFEPTRSRSENWTAADGYKTAGFWSRWLLWSEPTLEKGKKMITTRFGIEFPN